MVFGALLMLLVIHFIRRDGLRHCTLDAYHAEPAEHTTVEKLASLLPPR
jgi:hypothetical protein